MRKFSKLFVALILAVVLIGSSVYITAFAEGLPSSGECGADATYTFSNGVLTISGTGQMRNYDIGDSPFDSCDEIEKIIVESGITSIGENSFSWCNNLTEVSLPNTLTEIGEIAFYECNNLSEITIPNSLKSVGYMNFEYCSNMQTIYYMGTEEEFAKIDFGYSEDWSKFNIIYHNHTYKSTVTKATLTKNGKTVKKCAECGKTVSTVLYYPKTISISKTSYDYNGKVITPGVTVKNSKGKALKKGTDYTVSYSSARKKVGNYSATVNFKGNYTGKKVLKFKIMPKVSFASAALCVKQTKKINAKSSNKITYKSSNKKVASVNSKGVITAVKKGSATITVTSNKLSKTIKVKVSNPYIKLNKTKLSVDKGKSATLKATVFPSNAKVIWKSANTKIAKVSSKGKITGVKVGSTTVKATIKYKGKTYQKSCKVTVKKPKPVDAGSTQAAKRAKEYLGIMAFSRKGLIEQLEFEGFTNSQAIYGVDHSGANWKSQAVKKAKDYLDIMSFSRSGLIEQLEFEGFTSAEANYAVSEIGL